MITIFLSFLLNFTMKVDFVCFNILHGYIYFVKKKLFPLSHRPVLLKSNTYTVPPNLTSTVIVGALILANSALSYYPQSSIYSFMHLLYPLFSSRIMGQLAPISSSHCVKGSVHPGQVPNPTEGCRQTKKSDNHLHFHSHLSINLTYH